jgi:hypothetical protein
MGRLGRPAATRRLDLFGRAVNLLGEVTGDLVSRGERAKHRDLRGTTLGVGEALAEPATRVKVAARGRIDRRGNVALQDDPAAAALHLGIRDRDR